MSGFRIEGNTSGNVVEVDAQNNLKTIGPTTLAHNPGYIAMVSENDPGNVTGTWYGKSPETSDDYRLRVGMDTLLFDDSFNGTAQNTALWKFVAATTTMAMTSASGFISINSGNVLTANAGCYYQTWRTFAMAGTAPLYVEFTGNINAAPVANQVFEAGLFFGTASGATPTAPADGVFWRLTNAGLIGVITYNGAETATGILVATASIPLNNNAKYAIAIAEGAVEFWVDDVLLADLEVAAGNATPFLTDSLPVCMQMRNPGTVTGGTMIPRIGAITVSLADVASGKPWAHQMSGMGRHIAQTQNSTAVSTPTAIVGATLTTPNSATATAAALVNASVTTQFTGLGGVFQVLPTLTAGTDGLLCSYQNPAGGINQTPRELYITGVSISGAVAAALTGGPVVYAYTLAFGHTAVSLATTETASFATGTTKLSRRIALGVQACAATAAAGVQLTEIVRKFDAPIVVNPSEFIAVAARNLGTVTSGGSLAITVTFDGYWA